MFVVIRFVSLINLFKVLGFDRSYPSYAYHVIERHTHVHTTYTTRHIHNVHHTYTQRHSTVHRTHTTLYTPYTNAIHNAYTRHTTPIHNATPTIHTRHSLTPGHAMARYTLTDTHRTHNATHTPHPNAYPVGLTRRPWSHSPRYTPPYTRHSTPYTRHTTAYKRHISA